MKSSRIPLLSATFRLQMLSEIARSWVCICGLCGHTSLQGHYYPIMVLENNSCLAMCLFPNGIDFQIFGIIYMPIGALGAKKKILSSRLFYQAKVIGHCLDCESSMLASNIEKLYPNQHSRVVSTNSQIVYNLKVVFSSTKRRQMFNWGLKNQINRCTN